IMGMTWEELVEEYKDTVASEAAYDDLVGSIVPTEAEVKAKYDEYVEAYLADLEEDPTQYVYDALYGYTIYSTPEGVRKVRHILIAIDEDAAAAISLLRENGYDTQADYLLDAALADIQLEADEALGALQAGGTTFDAAIEQYNDDEDILEEGTPVIEGTDQYDEMYVEGAMALENIGDISAELIKTDLGYYIIEYYADETEGPVDYDVVYQEIYDELLDTLQSEAWSALITQWEDAAVIEKYDENLE
ncbi:MAG: peptidylprolyl isomerase, partial [Eubacteriales bacterium]|nr:peptidylprolyl isomerase [Eubacteriales bacterium]